MSGKTLEQGTFYIVVSDYNGASDYQLRVDGDFSTDDRGNSCANNPWIVRSKNETGTAGPYGDLDFFQFTLANTQTFKASALSGSGVYLKIYNRSCIPLTGNYYNNISFNLTAGLYYLSIEKYQNTSGATSYPYELNFDPSVTLKFPTGSCAGKAATLPSTNGDDVIKGTAGNDVIQAGLGNDVIYGLAGNDTLCGGEGDDVLIGADGTDSLNGEGGNDILQGGNANDALNGGLGGDTCDGGALTDTMAGCEKFYSIP
jgi:Ca2+-binding RTX toxin-like protein